MPDHNNDDLGNPVIGLGPFRTSLQNFKAYRRREKYEGDLGTWKATTSETQAELREAFDTMMTTWKSRAGATEADVSAATAAFPPWILDEAYPGSINYYKDIYFARGNMLEIIYWEPKESVWIHEVLPFRPELLPRQENGQARWNGVEDWPAYDWSVERVYGPFIQRPS